MSLFARTLFAASLALLPALAPAAADAAPWTIDESHTVTSFKVKHLGVSWVRGELGAVSGTVDFDPKNLAAAKADITIDVAGLSTRHDKRDEHLRSADFFDVANHPTLRFVSSKVANVSKDGRSFDLHGKLTIRGTTKDVVLPVRDFTHGATDPWGNVKGGATASLVLDRTAFGLNWNKLLEAGGLLVGNEVYVDIEVELNQAK